MTLNNTMLILIACVFLFLAYQIDRLRQRVKKLEEENEDNTMNTIEQIKKDILYDLYMAGTNMAGDYQGCWVRFKDIENIVNNHFRKILEDENDNNRIYEE